MKVKLRGLHVRDAAAATLFAALALGALCGCGVGKPVLVEDRPEIRKLIETDHQRLDCQVRIAPAVMSMPGAPESEDEYSISANAYSLDIENTIAGLLTDFEVFGEITFEEEEGDPYFVFCPEVTKYEIAYLGRNGYYVPNLLWWAFSPWASWLIADEDYSAALNAGISIKDADTYEEVWSGVVEAKVTKKLDDYQRGTKWFSIFGIGQLKQENWRRIEKTLRPHVLEEFKAKLLENLLSAETGRVLKERAALMEYRRRPPADWAIVVGIDSCPQLGEKHPRWCAESARQFAKALREAGYENVVEIPNAKIATITAAFKKADQQEESRVRRLLFYFAGVGASEYNIEKKAVKQSLLDCDGKKLSLAALNGLLEKAKADERVLILDAGFVTDALGRGVSLTGIPEDAAFHFPRELTSGSCGFLSACGPAQGAAEDSNLKSCLFTHYLLRTLSSPMYDSNDDDEISLQEVVDSDPIRFDLRRHCQLEYGMLQTPFLGMQLRECAVIEKTKK